SREHHDHRQCDHPVEGARRRRALRSGREAVPHVPLLTLASARSCGAGVIHRMHPGVEGAMDFELKTLSPEAVDRALARAERYRLLNEPGQAVSICLDGLDVQPENQTALTTLLLALTDQFDSDSSSVSDAWDTVSRLRDPYERAYYSGIVFERRAIAPPRDVRPRRRHRSAPAVRQ